MQDGRFRNRIIEERAKRAEFFMQLASLRGTRLYKVEYVITNHTPDKRKRAGLSPADAQTQRWSAYDSAEQQHRHWLRQTGMNSQLHTTYKYSKSVAVHWSSSRNIGYFREVYGLSGCIIQVPL